MIARPLFHVGTAEFVAPSGGVHKLSARIARTEAARERGLLDAGAEFFGLVAMVLVFDPPARARITTMGMSVPIDVVFVRASGEPVAIVEDARPYSVVYSVDEDVGYVVELPSGTARVLGVDRDSRFRLVEDAAANTSRDRDTST